jgi:hypothetical protein
VNVEPEPKQQQQQPFEVEDLLQQQPSRGDFAAVIAPLERGTGRALSEPGRSQCRRAFDENQAGFRLLAADALDRGRNPLALLVRMVADGDHRKKPSAPVAVNQCGCTHPECRLQDVCLQLDEEAAA